MTTYTLTAHFTYATEAPSGQETEDQEQVTITDVTAADLGLRDSEVETGSIDNIESALDDNETLQERLRDAAEEAISRIRAGRPSCTVRFMKGRHGDGYVPVADFHSYSLARSENGVER